VTGQGLGHQAREREHEQPGGAPTGPHQDRGDGGDGGEDELGRQRPTEIGLGDELVEQGRIQGLGRRDGEDVRQGQRKLDAHEEHLQRRGPGDAVGLPGTLAPELWARGGQQERRAEGQADGGHGGEVGGEAECRKAPAGDRPRVRDAERGGLRRSTSDPERE